MLFEMTKILVCGHATNFQDSWNLYSEGKERPDPAPDPACTSHSDVKLEGHSKKSVLHEFVCSRAYDDCL